MERTARPAWRNRAVVLWGGALGLLAIAVGIPFGRSAPVAVNTLVGAALLAGLARRQHGLDRTRLAARDLPWVLLWALATVAAVAVVGSLFLPGRR